MKLSSIQFSFGVSLLVHAVVFGFIAWKGTFLHPPELPREDSLVSLTLVAAPPENIASPENQTAVVAPAPALPIPPVVEEIKKSEFVIPAEKIQPTETLATPAPAPPSNPTTPIRGDGSSIKPGLDATTQTAQAGVKAEPNYLKNPEPFYPLLARRRHQEGLVLLTVKVSVQGRAAEVTLKQSSGFPLLDEAALKAVRNWEFVPARIGSLAVESQIEVPVRFKLTD